MPARNLQWKWILVTVVLLIAVVVLTSVVIHMSVSSSSDSNNEVDEADMESVIRKYGHLFVSMEDYEAKIEGRTGDGRSFAIAMCVTAHQSLLNSFSNGSSSNLMSPRTCTATVHLHGCCNSTVTFIAPKEAMTINNQRVRLIQYPPRYVQAFSIEVCNRVEGCVSDCECAKVLAYATAAIRGRRGVRTAIIKYEGCCKCLNVGYFKP